MKPTIRRVWYESVTPASTGRLPGLGAVGAVAVLAFCASVCASLTMGAFAIGCATGASSPGSASSGAPASPAVGLVAGAAPTVASATTVTMAGARCTGGTCKCRQPGTDDPETQPPAAGAKRFEIRLSVVGGSESIDLSDLGTFAASAPDDESMPDVTQPVHESCAYIDVPAGSLHDVAFVARESIKGRGVAPRMRIAEYGPKGPYWYDLITVGCEGSSGRCDRAAAEAWGASSRQRKRGRLDPCGSAVLTRLRWETSGGQAERDGGLFRDFSVSFAMEVKKFATSFAPGSPECVPK